VRERETGTLEQLIVTPLTRTEIMLGKIAPYVLVGIVQLTAVLSLGHCCSTCRSAAACR
jgi:ABC-2 type transport system permease protein